ncbi:uncharacterized protein [Hyperolius riggenbachi]|uniref:uncharacterized protein isoform X2 n=1 Tax=Hyperolius riggenbachi TaxID=752182 RepID=UPI0035A3C1B3
MSQGVQRGGQGRSPGHLAAMRGYVALLVPAFLVVVAATDAPPTDAPPTAVHRTSAPPISAHPTAVHPTGAMAVTATPHDVTVPHLPPDATTRLKATAGAIHPTLPVTVPHLPPDATTRLKATAGAIHPTLPVTLPHLPPDATTRPEATAGAIHPTLPVTVPHLPPDATTRLKATAGDTHHALPVTFPHLPPDAKTRPEATAGAIHPTPPDTPGKPEIRLGLHQNVFIVSCFSASNIPNLHYELIQNRAVVQNMTVHTNQPANFTIQTPGFMQLQCRARSPSGSEASSDIRKVNVTEGRSAVNTSRTQHGETDTPAKPEIILGITQHGLVVSCFSASKIPVIQYELIQDSKVVQNVTVHTNQPANFTIQTSGAMQLQCLARGPLGREALSIVQNVSVDKGNQDVRLGVSVHPVDAEEKVSEAGPSDGEETDPGQEDRKNRAAMMALVFQAVQDTNILILCICGPTLLLILLVVLFVTHLRNRRERKVALI